ncbi:sensor histidine kinase [Cellulosilyticum ruminicola]|uniref:sensor histidine kinase n=1 Tax=Cellulosilyticum ruminicola TaxID=425254 RepID=UPI0006D108EF|nr:sensor histidine kinase [Cellulosilyticum ruminicola]
MKNLGTHIRKKYLDMPLRRKLKLFILMSLLPMVCLMLWIFVKFRTYTDAYMPIVAGINKANDFDMHFKEEVDYSMYRIVSGSLKFEDSGINEVLKKTYASFKSLKEGTSLQYNKEQIERAQKNLELLESRIRVIETNCKTTGHYDENIEILGHDVYVITGLISDEITQYVYYEALELQRLGQRVKQQTNTLINVSMVIFLGIVVVTWLLVSVVSNSITRPLQYLCKRTKEVGDGDFTTQQVKGGDEVAALEKSFNTMVGKIDELVVNIKKEQQNLRKVELQLLQAQINPHFLYNTLDTIIWMAEDGKSEEVVEIVAALSDFFRIGLSKGREYISLKEEAKHIRSYLQIQKFRYADRMTYTIDLPEELGEYRLLKLILQPLVENALYHGVKQKRGMSEIYVTAFYAEEELLLKVSDTGRGMTQEELGKVKKRLAQGFLKDAEGGFGLANVNERIRLNYGKEYGLSIESTYGVGTQVTIHLPLADTHIV